MMRNKIEFLRYRLAALGLGMIAGTSLLAGCGTSKTELASAAAPVAQLQVQGNVHGGQQPVAGATIQIYVASSIGYGAGSYALLNANVTTTSAGNFTFSGDYTCPSASSLVYVTATGGNSGFGSNNPNIALMATLGACSNLSDSTYVSINELTTVASVYSLAAFMTDYNAVGSSPGNVQGLMNAFATVNKLVNTGTGQVPGPALPSGSTVPTMELNTLADILAVCVNSGGGTAGDGSGCGTLFSDTTPPGGTAPTNTVMAALNMAKYPSRNVSALILTIPPSAPYETTLSSATDFTVSIKYAPAGVFSTPSAAAVDAGGDLWVTNAGSNSVAVLTPAGGAPAVYMGGSLSGPSGIAFDASGNAWVPNKTNSTLSVFTPAGSGSLTPVVGLSAPTGIAIDGQNLLWITSSGNNSVEVVGVSGNYPSYSTYYMTAGVNTPGAVVINTH